MMQVFHSSASSTYGLIWLTQTHHEEKECLKWIDEVNGEYNGRGYYVSVLVLIASFLMKYELHEVSGDFESENVQAAKLKIFTKSWCAT
jgi:hypothetical protein